MSIAQVRKERRFSQRLKLSGLMPGKVTVALTGKCISCRPVDVSQHGLGMLTTEKLLENDEICIALPEQVIRMRIAWKRPDFGKSDLTRYGLMCLDESVDVESLFRDAECLRYF